MSPIVSLRRAMQHMSHVHTTDASQASCCVVYERECVCVCVGRFSPPVTCRKIRCSDSLSVWRFPVFRLPLETRPG